MSKEILAMFQSGYSDLAGPTYDVGGMAEALSNAVDIINGVSRAAQALLNEVVVPEVRCSCHVEAPCTDCTANGGLRTAVSDLKASLDAMQELLKATRVAA